MIDHEGGRPARELVRGRPARDGRPLQQDLG